MRVCFLADAGSVNTQTWVEHFAEVMGHDVHVVSVKRPGSLSKAVTVHVIGKDDGTGTKTLGGKLLLLRSLAPMRRIVREIDPDIVVGYRVASYGYLGARIGVHPLAVAAQGQILFSPSMRFPMQHFAATALRHADVVNSWAPHMTDCLVRHGARPKTILTLPRGIDLEAFRPRGDGADREPAAVVTRGLHRTYSIDIAVRAIAQVALERDGFTGSIAGKGLAEAELRDLAKRLPGGEAVRFLSEVPNGDLPSLLAGSAVYLSTVPRDGVSASLLEGMACGAFPIVRDNTANRLWIEDGVNGFLVGRDEPEDYARAITRALDDDELRRSAAAANRKIVEERADIMKNMKTIEARYTELVRKAGGPV